MNRQCPPAFRLQGLVVEMMRRCGVLLQYIYNWLQEVMKTHFEMIVACLLPHPVEYSKVGGFW